MAAQNDAEHEAAPELAPEQLAHPLVGDGETSDGDRLALRPDGIREVDESRHEEGHRHLRFQGPRETAHDGRGQHASGQTHQQPGQAMARAPDGRVFESLAGMGALAGDPGHAVQIFHMLVPEDLEERPGRNDSQKAPGLVRDRHRGQAMPEGGAGDVLLVGVEAHDQRRQCADLSDRFMGPEAEEIDEGAHAQELAGAVDHVDILDGTIILGLEGLDHAGRRVAGSSDRHALDQMLRGGLGSMGPLRTSGAGLHVLPPPLRFR